MRARLLAFLILVVLIGIPVSLYWYFFRANTSGVVVHIPEWIEASVALRGTFSYDWLPLADSILQYSKICRELCEFSPIPHASYTIQITHDDFHEYTHTFILEKGQTMAIEYQPKRKINLETIRLPHIKTVDDITLFEQDIQKEFGQNYEVLGIDLQGRRWVAEKRSDGTMIGMYISNRIAPVKHIALDFETLVLDIFGETIIGVRGDQVLLLSLDMDTILETSFSGQIVWASFLDTWHIVTEEGEFDFVQNEWQENVRFSAWRDINTEWRMGYIDAQDTEKMQRSNFVPEEGSVIVLLNRMNGKIFEVTRGIDAKNMFVYEERGVIFDGRDFYLVDL